VDLNLSRLKALRSLQVGAWGTDFPLGDHLHTVVTEVFSTIASPVFSELVIVFAGRGISPLPRDTSLFTTLYAMNEIRPFQLVFLLEVSGCSQEEALRELAGVLEPVYVEGLLDFLGSPPVVRSARFRQQGWGWDTPPTDLY